MLDQLLAIVETGKFQDLGRIDLVQATWVDCDLILRFNVSPDGDRSETWIIECSSTVEYLLSKATNGGLQFWTDAHPAAAQYAEPFEDLYFGNAAVDSQGFLGKVWLAHRQATDDWIPFDRYLNRQVTPRELFSADRGLFATGPSFLIEVYADILKEEGMRPRRLASSSGTYLPNATMIHFGDSYVIAAEFSCRKTDA